MADPEQVARIRCGVKGWNAWREKNPDVNVNLSAADLGGAELGGANLRGATLTQADLHSANLRGAMLQGATLFGADLREADLSRADLSMADLRAADLRKANLLRAHLEVASFQAARLSHANLYEAVPSETNFGNTDLKDVIGLDTCLHEGPSVIDHRTLARSGPLPEAFLRGCGLPDPLIAYLPSLLSDGAIQFYSCFISYSTKDQEFADRLYADLQNKGVRCWFAPHDMQGGKKLHEQIDQAIRMHERLLLILSPHSMNSAWVETEIRNARTRERAEKKRVLFPVRLVSYDALREWKLFDADEGRDLAVEIREYYIPDFSKWKSHDLYQKEFGKLVRDLRTGHPVEK